MRHGRSFYLPALIIFSLMRLGAATEPVNSGCSVTSSAACARFFALVAARPSFSSVSTRASAPVGSAVLPVYNALGGPQGNGHVTFDRTKSQYLDAGPRTLNIATNGGLTIVAVARFTGTAGYYERIIDLIDFGVSRAHLNSGMWVWSSNKGSGPDSLISLLPGVIVQSVWLTVVVRYRPSGERYWVTVNGVPGTLAPAVVASADLTDRTVYKTYVGRSSAPNDAFFNGDMAGVFVVDEYLSAEATSALADAMVQGVDLTSTPVTIPTPSSTLPPASSSASGSTDSKTTSPNLSAIIGGSIGGLIALLVSVGLIVRFQLCQKITLCDCRKIVNNYNNPPPSPRNQTQEADISVELGHCQDSGAYV
jgi:hypothetical protein